MLSQMLANVPDAVRPNVEAAIETVREVAPHAELKPYAMAPPKSRSTMWKLVRFSSHGEDAVGVGTFAAHTTLYFYRGVELDDGSGLLTGTGKQMRSITLRKPEDARTDAVKNLVRRAFELAGTR